MSSKQFAYVNGLNKIFDKKANAIGLYLYDITAFKKCTDTEHLSNTTICFIIADEDDKLLGYNGNYIYTQYTLFSNYNNYGGQYLTAGLINLSNNEERMFLFGDVTISEQYAAWYITYHILSYSNNSNLNADYDVCVRGVGSIITDYYSYNNVKNAPYKYHVASVNGSSIKLGVSIFDTLENAASARNISITITSANNCSFTHAYSEITGFSSLNGVLFDAETPGFIESNNEINLRIKNVVLKSSEKNGMHNVPKTLYAFNKNGELQPLTNLGSNLIPIPASFAKGTSGAFKYSTEGFDWKRGLFYSPNYCANQSSINGDIYSAYGCMDLRYIDNMNNRVYGDRPLYIRGTLGADGYFYIAPNTTEDYTYAIYDNISEDSTYVYWQIGFPVFPNGTSELIYANLLELNVLVKYDESSNSIHSISGGIATFTPSGTISTLTFYGDSSTISVSGSATGTNADSSVSIDPETTSIKSVTSLGSIASLTYNAEELTFDGGSTPSTEDVNVWTGYKSATAAAQVFTGSNVTFTGTYTPTGTLSQATFTGNETTIII